MGVAVVATSLNFSNPLAEATGYLLALLSVDFGMTAVAVLSWILGRLLWREDVDPRYLAVAIGFAGLPVWGVLQTVCVTFILPEFSLSVACIAISDLIWLPVLWLVVLPVSSIFIDFGVYVRTNPDSAQSRVA